MNDASGAPAPDRPKLDDPDLFRFFNEIGIINQLATTALERALPPPLTRAQFTMLNHLARLGGPRSPVSMAEAFQVTKGAVTHTIQKLEAQGLITVAPAPDDGRGKLVDLTDAGHVMRQACVDALGSAFREVAAAFSKEEIAAALPLLTRMRKFLDDARN